MKFKHSYIDSESVCFTNPADIKLGRQDILIVGASWDSRCTWLTKISDLEVDLGIVITYDRCDDAGHQRENEELISVYLEHKCREVKKVRGCSTNINELWEKVFKIIVKYYLLHNNYIDMCVDITAIPRYCSLATLAGCIRRALTRKINFLYAEGDYDNLTNTNELTFHEGAWRSIPVAFLEVQYNPRLKKFMLVSVGFEGDRIIRVTQEEEPDRLLVLLPSPGFKKEYEEIALNANQELIGYYRIEKNDYISAPAGDAIQAWYEINKANVDLPGQENSFYLCCGTKPHALALGLHALTSKLGTCCTIYLTNIGLQMY
jgi:hypothetical protein